MQHAGGLALEHLVPGDIKTLRKLTAVNYHGPYRLRIQRELPAEPVQLCLVSVELWKLGVPADVVPVYMRGNRYDRSGYQSRNLAAYPAYAQTAVYEQAAFLAVEEIAVRFLPVPVFAYNVGAAVKPVYGEPVSHTKHPLLKHAAEVYYTYTSAAKLFYIPHVSISTRPSGRKLTPSSASRRRWTSGPPKA